MTFVAIGALRVKRSVFYEKIVRGGDVAQKVGKGSKYRKGLLEILI